MADIVFPHSTTSFTQDMEFNMVFYTKELVKKDKAWLYR